MASESSHEPRDGAGPWSGGALLVAFVTANDRAAAQDSWRRHLADPGSPPTSSGAALFAVLEGEGDFVLFHEPAGRSNDAEKSIRNHFGSSAVLSVAYFKRIFAAEDARSLSAASRFLFLARASVDASIDHEAFNAWYDGTHVPDVAAAGLQRAQRYRGADDTDDYLASYEIESPAVLDSEELAQVRGFHHFTPSIRQLRRTVGEFVAGAGDRR